MAEEKLLKEDDTKEEHDVVNQNTEKIESDDNNESNKEDENDDHQTVVDRRRKQKQINDDDSSDSENEHQRRTEELSLKQHRNLDDYGNSDEESEQENDSAADNERTKEENDHLADNEESEEDNDANDNEEGESQEEEEPAQDEVPKDSPMYVPRGGPYFQHDSRFDDTEEEQLQQEEDNEEKQNITSYPGVGKWEHDMYREEEQKPRQEWEKKKDRIYYDNREQRSNETRDNNRGRKPRLNDYMTQKGMPRREQRDGRGFHRDNRRPRYEESNNSDRRGFHNSRGSTRNRYENRYQNTTRDNSNRKEKEHNRRENNEREKHHREGKEEKQTKQKTTPTKKIEKKPSFESNVLSNKVTEGGSLFKPVSFASSKVFSLSSQSNRLVVKEVENDMKRRGRGRGIRYKHKDIPVTVGKIANEEIKENDEAIKSTEDTVNDVANEKPNDITDDMHDKDVSTEPSNDTIPTQDGDIESSLQTLDLADTDKFAKPKRYSSQRQKPGEFDTTTNEAGQSALHSNLPKGGRGEEMTGKLPPTPLATPHFGWLPYPPPHPQIMPLDPASFQQQQMMYMRMLQEMYPGVPPMLPMFPPPPPSMVHSHPSVHHFSTNVPAEVKPPVSAELTPSIYTTNSNSNDNRSTNTSNPGLFIPQMAPEQQRLRNKAVPSEKPSQAIPIVAPDEAK